MSLPLNFAFHSRPPSMQLHLTKCWKDFELKLFLNPWWPVVFGSLQFCSLCCLSLIHWVFPSKVLPQLCTTLVLQSIFASIFLICLFVFRVLLEFVFLFIYRQFKVHFFVWWGHSNSFFSTGLYPIFQISRFISIPGINPQRFSYFQLVFCNLSTFIRLSFSNFIPMIDGPTFLHSSLPLSFWYIFTFLSVSDSNYPLTTHMQRSYHTVSSARS